MYCFRSIFYFFLLLKYGEAFSRLWLTSLDNLRQYEKIIPSTSGTPYSGNIRTKIDDGKHPERTVIEFSAFKRYFRIYLFKNELILPSSFINLQQYVNGSIYHGPRIENCYYQGHLYNESKSSAAFSTCDGLRGVIHNENGEEFIVQPLAFSDITKYNLNSWDHIIYRSKDVLKKVNESYSCGHKHTYRKDIILKDGYDEGMLRILPQHYRRKRGVDLKKYVELIIVVDQGEFLKYGSATEKRALEIANYADNVYKTMNTRIAVQGLIIWKSGDKIAISKDAAKTIGEFETYTEEILFGKMKLKADSVLLLTAIKFAGPVGLAGVGTMCSMRSCAMVYDVTSDTSIVANVVAHEIGHTFGFQHNSKSCKCSNPPCVMAAYTPGEFVQGFSDCTQKEYTKRLDDGSLTCLYDYPDKLYAKPKCGNGFVEAGEACDCGSPEECSRNGGNECCIPKLCKLQPTADCANGPCCDKCQFRPPGFLCRPAYDKECDLPEYCRGNSMHCTKNFYRQDGAPCNLGNGSCFHGSCMSLNLQCKTLWGPNAIKGHDHCFEHNMNKDDKLANCGTDENGKPIACAEKDIFCGKLQCMSKSQHVALPIYPIIGESNGGRMVKTIKVNNPPYCKMAYIPFEKDLQDPTIALSGTKCGDGKMCHNKECKNFTKFLNIIPCKTPCYNGGVCNNNGNCHCKPGFACPTCEYAGPGGSIDSGLECSNQKECGCLTFLVKSMLVLFLAVIPFMSLIIYLVVTRRGEIQRRWIMHKSKRKNGKNIQTNRNNEKTTRNVEEGANKYKPNASSAEHGTFRVTFGGHSKSPEQKPGKPIKQTNKGKSEEPVKKGPDSPLLRAAKKAEAKSGKHSKISFDSMSFNPFKKSSNSSNVESKMSNNKESGINFKKGHSSAIGKNKEEKPNIVKKVKAYDNIDGANPSEITSTGEKILEKNKLNANKSYVLTAKGSSPKPSKLVQINAYNNSIVETDNNSENVKNKSKKALNFKSDSEGKDKMQKGPKVEDKKTAMSNRGVIGPHSPLLPARNKVQLEKEGNAERGGKIIRSSPKPSPKPGKLAQIDMYNKMDMDAGNIRKGAAEVAIAKTKL